MTQIVAQVAVYVLNALSIMMLLRAVSSWLPIRHDNKLVWLLHVVTEPVIAPIRALLHRFFPRSQQFPIDISFMVAYLLIIMLQALLQNMLISFALYG